MKSFCRYFLLIFAGITMLLGVINILGVTSSTVSHGTTVKSVFSYFSYLSTFTATIIIFVGALKKKRWLLSFAYGYMIILLEDVYRLIVMHNMGAAIVGTILNLFFLLPIYCLFSKEKINKFWLYIGLVVGISDLVFSILHF